MRRQTAGTREVPEGTGRHVRLDPFDLPARVAFAGPARAGAAVHTVVIDREAVMIHRTSTTGLPLYISVPVSSYRGVLLSAREEDGAARVVLRLLHANGDLGVPLLEADDADDVIADWRAWGSALGRPLLIEDAEGQVREPFSRLGAVLVKPVKARRVNTFFAERRPRFLCARRVGGPPPGRVHREDEIIARDVTD